MLMNGLLTLNNTGFLAATETRNQSLKTDNKSGFQDILNNRINYAESQGRDPVRKTVLQNSGNVNERNLEEPVKYKTFREFEREMKVEAKKPEIKEKSGVPDDSQNNGLSPEDTKITGIDKTETVLNCLAQIMGLKPEELVKLLDSAGIKPEELASASASEAVAAKLSRALGLDIGMEKALEKLLRAIVSEVDHIVSGDPGAGSGDKIAWIKADGLDTVLPQEANGAPGESDAGIPEAEELQGLILKLKLKLTEMEEKLAGNQNGLTDEILDEIQLYLKTDPNRIKLSAKMKEAASLENPDNGMETSQETGTAEGDSGIEAKSEKPVEKGVLPQQQTAVKTDVPENAQVFANVMGQLQSQEADSSLENIHLRTPVQAKEIIHQVVEKAKFVITADKSEMIMDLKPDSLGKLSLKVVTEHGMIMARFVAENQQVKQVLEANMQLLKDSLEKQGLNVQGFSVSVRQESQDGRNHFEGRDRSENRRLGSTEPVSGGGIFIDAAVNERLQSINPYRHEGTTINLTA